MLLIAVHVFMNNSPLVNRSEMLRYLLIIERKQENDGKIMHASFLSFVERKQLFILFFLCKLYNLMLLSFIFFPG